LSLAQRRLSTPARFLRRRVTEVAGHVTVRDGGTVPLDYETLLTPLDGALKTMSLSIVLVATAFALARLG
jgi:hypothetical protein